MDHKQLGQLLFNDSRLMKFLPDQLLYAATRRRVVLVKLGAVLVHYLESENFVFLALSGGWTWRIPFAELALES